VTTDKNIHHDNNGGIRRELDAFVSWLVNEFKVSIAAMVGGLLLFFLPVDLKKGKMTPSWQEGMAGIDWGTLLLFGGGLAMGGLMYSTGLSDWISNGINTAELSAPSADLLDRLGYGESNLLTTAPTMSIYALQQDTTVADKVRLTWQYSRVPTTSETVMFKVMRRETANDNWSEYGNVTGDANPKAGTLLMFEDSNLANPQVRYQYMVRLELMRRFGYYLTESSEHSSEYTPYFIKKNYPELIGRYCIPLDEYPRRCIRQIDEWKKRGHELTSNPYLSHVRSKEYASRIMEAMETDRPVRIGGNVLNSGLIDNLPSNACVEVPCLVDRCGVQPCHVGSLPEQCAALNRTNINVQLMAIEAAMTRRKEAVYQAVMLDPHTSAELSIDDIVAMCDDLFEAHSSWLPAYH